MLILKDFSIQRILKIIFLQEIPGYSEFLISFAFIYILVYLFKNKLNNFNNIHYILFAVISLLMTFINYDLIRIPILGVFIGTSSFCCFPIIQYSSYFFAGMYLASRHKICNIFMLIVSMIGSGTFIVYYTYFHKIPNRFPPSILWITRGYFFILLYFVICKKLSFIWNKIPLHIIGQNTLAYLVVSNIFLFVMHKIGTPYFTELCLNYSSSRIKRFYLFCFLCCIALPYCFCMVITYFRRMKISK